MDGTAFGDNVAEIKRPVIPCIRTFKRSGKSGIPVSDILPNIAGVIDEIAVVRSMWNHEGNHFPAVIETATGHRGLARSITPAWEVGFLTRWEARTRICRRSSTSGVRHRPCN